MEAVSHHLALLVGSLFHQAFEEEQGPKSQHGLGLATHHEQSLFQAVATMAMLVFCGDRIMALGGA